MFVIPNSWKDCKVSAKCKLLKPFEAVVFSNLLKFAGIFLYLTSVSDSSLEAFIHILIGIDNKWKVVCLY